MFNHAIPLKEETRGDNIFYFLHKFLGKIVTKRFEEPFWIMIWIYHYFLIGIRLDLDLDNSCWIRIIPKVCYKQH